MSEVRRVGVHRLERDARFQVVETHISTLFFTPDRVYKLLKPLRTGFLDHVDSAARIADAHAELLLNRRLAPDVYLGEADVCEEDELVDRMIVMRRLPADRCLSRLVGEPEFERHLVDVARAIAAFHAQLPPVAEPVPLSTADGLAGFWRSSADEMSPFVGAVFVPDEFDEVRRLAADYLDHHAGLLDVRRTAGFVRDGHGDLIADDIFLMPDGPRILDCLAFDPAYRVSDVLADIAFLVMDIERLAGRDAARLLLRSYCQFSNEHHPASLAHHYVAYRAHVRAKVAALRWHQGDTSARHVARQFHHQAYDHLQRAVVTLVLLGGGPGTGKSTLAEALGDELGWAALDSDTLRKDLHGIDHLDHRVELHPELYSADATDTTYGRLVDRASSLLGAGESVILDATWAREAHRELARRVARQQGARLVEFECQVDPDLARDRIAARRRAGDDASDATPDLVGGDRDPWPTAINIDTRRPVAAGCGLLVSHLTVRV